MKTKKDMRLKRKLAIRHKLSGTKERLRMAVYRSNTRFSVQLIDDTTGATVISESVMGKNTESAKKIGMAIAMKAKEKGIKTVVFDRGGFRYHGAIKVLADAAREGGLVF